MGVHITNLMWSMHHIYIWHNLGSGLAIPQTNLQSSLVYFSKVSKYPELPGKLSRTYHDHFVDEALIGLNGTIKDNGIIMPARPHC